MFGISEPSTLCSTFRTLFWGGGERYDICQGALQSCLPMPELRGWAVLQALRDLEEGEEAAELTENWLVVSFFYVHPDENCGNDPI